MKLPKSYMTDQARAQAKAIDAMEWYNQESHAATEAGDDDASQQWSWRMELPLDVLLVLRERHGAAWMKNNVEGDWQARRVWGHQWHELSLAELQSTPAYVTNYAT
jgi:hypothetical protein